MKKVKRQAINWKLENGCGIVNKQQVSIQNINKTPKKQQEKANNSLEK